MATASRKWEIWLEHSKADYADLSRESLEEILIKNWLDYMIPPITEKRKVIYAYDEFDAWKGRAQYDRLYWVHQERAEGIMR